MSTGSPSVRNYLRMLFRRKWALVLPAAAGVVAGGLLFVPPFSRLIPPEYDASVLLRRADLAILRSTPGTLVSRGAPSASVAVLREEILTWTNLQTVAEKTSLDVGLATSADWQNMYRQLRNAIRIRSAGQSRGIDLIEMQVTHRRPDLAANIANAVADQYVEETKAADRKDSKDAVDFLQDGTEEHRQNLRDTEERLEEYRKENFSDLPEVKGRILSSRLHLQTEQESRSLQLTDARNRLDELGKQLEGVPETVTAEAISEPNPEAQRLQDDLAVRKRVVLAMLEKATEEHPDVKRLRTEIASLEQQLAEVPRRIDGRERVMPNEAYLELQSEKRALEQEIRGHDAALRQIDASIRANEKELRTVVEEEEHWNDLLRKKAEHSELYDTFRRSLTAARTRLEVEAGEYGTKVEIVARALEPTRPSQKRRMKMLLLCLLGGLATGVGLMFGQEFCDRSFRDREDADKDLKDLGIPVLGSITTIVTAEDVAERRRGRRLTAGLAVSLLVLGGAAYLVLEQFAPAMKDSMIGNVKSLLRTVRSYLRN